VYIIENINRDFKFSIPIKNVKTSNSPPCWSFDLNLKSSTPPEFDYKLKNHQILLTDEKLTVFICILEYIHILTKSRMLVFSSLSSKIPRLAQTRNKDRYQRCLWPAENAAAYAGLAVPN